MRDLHSLPKVSDSWTFLYAERCIVEQDAKAIALIDKDGRVPVPCANLLLLMLGPGTKITHSAMKTIVDNGCTVVWVGEQGVRCYAVGLGKTRSARNILRQARLLCDDETRMSVVRHMYEMRFREKLSPDFTLQQIRGKEGARVRDIYALWSEKTGVPWQGRAYFRADWKGSDTVNRALSTANSCLYGICQAAILALGYSPALGFVHTGKALSFVYDIADLYKMDVTVPIAFTIAQQGNHQIDTRVRYACREAFRCGDLLRAIVRDLQTLIGDTLDSRYDSEDDPPGGLWDPDGTLQGGMNFAVEAEEPIGPEEIVPQGDVQVTEWS